MKHLQVFEETDPPQWIQVCQWLMQQIAANANFSLETLLTNEIILYKTVVTNFHKILDFSLWEPMKNLVYLKEVFRLRELR